MHRCLSLLLLFFFASSLLQAQKNNNRDYYSEDVGVFVGSTYYIGDLNPRTHLNGSSPAIGLFYRFNYSQRFAFRGGIQFGSIRADDSQSINNDQLERNLNFKSNIEDIYAVSEFNFVEYLSGSYKFRFTPFVFLGLNLFHFNPMGNYEGTWIALQDLTTEGQKTTQNPKQKPYRLIQIGVPFGIGMKLNVADRLALGLEWSPRKLFTDYLDDVSNKYVNPIILSKEKGSVAGLMSNRSIERADWINNTGKMRGNPNTKDWYFFYGITLSIQLKKQLKECKGADI